MEKYILTKEEFVSLMFGNTVENITECERKRFKETFGKSLDDVYYKIFENYKGQIENERYI